MENPKKKDFVNKIAESAENILLQGQMFAMMGK